MFATLYQRLILLPAIALRDTERAFLTTFTAGIASFDARDSYLNVRAKSRADTDDAASLNVSTRDQSRPRSKIGIKTKRRGRALGREGQLRYERASLTASVVVSHGVDIVKVSPVTRRLAAIW